MAHRWFAKGSQAIFAKTASYSQTIVVSDVARPKPSYVKVVVVPRDISAVAGQSISPWSLDILIPCES